MDRMDDIWKDRFNSDELPVDSWNSPDDFVWESVASQTVRKKKKRFGWWLWWFLGGLGSVLLVAVLSFLIAGEGTSVSPTVQKGTFLAEANAEKETQFVENNNSNTNFVNVEIKDLEKKKNGTKEEIISQEKSITRSVAIKEEKATKVFNYKKESKTTFLLPVKTTSQESDSSIANSQEANESIKKSTITIPLENTVVFNAPVEEAVETPKNFNDLAIDLVTTNFTLTNAAFDVSDRETEKLKNKKVIYFSLNVGTSYWKHNISQQYTSDLSEFEFNYTDNFGYLLDLDLDIPLGKRFMLQLGMDYEQININSGHNSPLSYDPGQETNGDTNNDYALSLATPYGLSDAEFSFARSENIGEDPVNLLVDFHSAHTIKNFSLPIGVLYSPFGQSNRFSPYLKAGFGFNYLRGISNDIAFIDTHHSSIQYDRSGVSNFDAPDVKKWHYDYRLGVGASYRCTSKLSLRIHYEYVNGLNAIYKQDNYKTKINRHHLSVGLSSALFDFP